MGAVGAILPPMSRRPSRPARTVSRVLILGLLCATGCSKPPPIAEFGFLVTRPDVVQPVVVQRDVEGRSCFTENLLAVTLRPPWNARLADHGAAVRDALSRYPTANAMSDVRILVRVEQYLLFQRICAVVHGDVGTLR